MRRKRPIIFTFKIMFSFCRPVSDKRRFKPHRKLGEDYTFTLFENSRRIEADDWDSVLKDQNVFLNRAYLGLIQKCAGLVSRYVIVYSNKKPVGIIYLQVVDFRAGIFGDLITGKVNDIRSSRMSMFGKYIDSNKDEVLLRLFTCGNNLVSGLHGYQFSREIREEVITGLVLCICDVISKEEKLRGTISALLLKDFEKPLRPKELLEEEKYIEFKVEPNMVVDIPAGVKDLSEYITLFSKKYRNRAKGILKSAESVEIRDLSADEIRKYEKDIYAMYESVYEKAKFKLIKLPADYFSAVKEIMDKEFFVTAFFIDGKMLAFTSYFLMHGSELEAHYIGFRYELNQELDLYQNILYCNISAAIKNGRRRVNLGRTAAEMKSTVGAKAEDLYCYARPQNTISKLIMRPLISFLQPGEWIPRNPFKEEGAEKVH